MKKIVFALCACFLFAAVAESHALAAPFTPPPYGTFISWQDDTQVVVAWYHVGIDLGTFYVYRSSNGITWTKVGQHGYYECCGYWWTDTTAGTSNYGYRITVDAPGYDESAPSNEIWRFGAPTPVPTMTPTPYTFLTPTPTSVSYNATVTPRPTATPVGVKDPNFMRSDYDTPWTKSGAVSWTFGRMTLAPGASITQYIDHITGTKNITYTVMAGADLTTSLQIDFGGVMTTSQVSKKIPRVFADAGTVSFPITVTLRNVGSAPLVLSYVSWNQVDEKVGAQAFADPVTGFGSGTGAPAPLGIGGFMDWFTPYKLTEMPDVVPLFEGTSWREFGVRPGMKIFATILAMVTPRLLPRYIATRLLLIVIAWIMGFVLDRISKSKPMIAAMMMAESNSSINAVFKSYRHYSGIARSTARRSRGRRSRKGW